MPYCLMNLRPAVDGSGREPAFPDDMSFHLLADARDADWGLYEYLQSEEFEDWRPSEPVSDSMHVLIESGRRYPPALAIARDSVTREFAGKHPSRESFLDAYGSALEGALRRQGTDGCRLARARGDQVGYMRSGGWYWVLRAVNGDTQAEWVSDDYFIYRNAIGDFDLSKADLESLSERSIARQAVATDGASRRG